MLAETTALFDAFSSYSLGAFAAILVAGFVRGYGGFGFALAAVPLLSSIWEPRHALPTVLLLEMALSLAYLPSNWRLVEWRGVGALLSGAALATPAGLYLLSSAPPNLMRMGVGSLLLISVLLLWQPLRQTDKPRWVSVLAAGSVSGLMSGSTAMSGPPIILHYMSTKTDPRTCRASMIAYFLASSAVALLFGTVSNLYVGDYLADGLILAPVALAGSFVGSWCFKFLPAPSYRRITLCCLAALGAYTIARGLSEVQLLIFYLMETWT